MKHRYECSYCAALFETENECFEHEHKHPPIIDIEHLEYKIKEWYPSKIFVHFKDNQVISYSMTDIKYQKITHI